MINIYFLIKMKFNIFFFFLLKKISTSLFKDSSNFVWIAFLGVRTLKCKLLLEKFFLVVLDVSCKYYKFSLYLLFKSFKMYAGRICSCLVNCAFYQAVVVYDAFSKVFLKWFACLSSLYTPTHTLQGWLGGVFSKVYVFLPL